MPEELLHEREYTRTGIAPAGSSIALADMDASGAADKDEIAAKTGSNAELGKAGAQNGHTNGTTVCRLANPLCERDQATLLGCLMLSGESVCTSSALSESCRGPHIEKGGCSGTISPSHMS